MLPNSVLNSLLLFAKVISSHFKQLALRFGLPPICYCPGCGYCFRKWRVVRESLLLHLFSNLSWIYFVTKAANDGLKSFLRVVWNEIWAVPMSYWKCLLIAANVTGSPVLTQVLNQLQLSGKYHANGHELTALEAITSLIKNKQHKRIDRQSKKTNPARTVKFPPAYLQIIYHPNWFKVFVAVGRVNKSQIEMTNK